MSSRSGGKRRRAKFRAWGLVLTVLAVISGIDDDWKAVGVLSSIWVVYMGLFRLCRCRVETRANRPCRWFVRGLIGTCDYHVGDKQGMPVFIRRGRFPYFPMLMWPRNSAVIAPTPAEPQPATKAPSRDATAAKARRPAYDWIMMGLSAAGVIATMVGLIPR